MDTLIVHRMIVHELGKQPEERDVKLTLSNSLLPLTDTSMELVLRLEQIFESKADILQGFLAEPDESLFPGYYVSWMEAGQDREAFVQMSKEMMRALQLGLTGVIGAKGGYLLFVDYTVEEQRMLGVFMIRDRAGLTFVQAGDKMDINVVTHLDVDNLAMAVRIMNGPGRNVQLLRHSNQQRKISQYFQDWVSLRDAESSAELTWTFLESVSELPLPMDKETGYAMESTDFDRALVRFAVKMPQQTISPKVFDEHFYGNETPLQNYLADAGNISLAEGFRVNRKLLRSQLYLKASLSGLTVHCTKEHYDQGIVSIDEESGEIKIVSLDLARMLLDQVE